MLALETDVDLGIRVGARLTLEGESVMGAVFRTGRAARQESYEDTTGTLADIARTGRFGTAVGAPIVVEGRLWGVLVVSSRGYRLPADTEQRLGDFGEIVATAISNTEARAEVQRLADEQAALRRVATLVARESSPEEVFAAVAEELERLFDARATLIGRLEPDDTMTHRRRQGDRNRRAVRGQSSQAGVGPGPDRGDTKRPIGPGRRLHPGSPVDRPADATARHPVLRGGPDHGSRGRSGARWEPRRRTSSSRPTPSSG